MKKMTKKILALVASLSLLVAPVAFAQDVPADTASLSAPTTVEVSTPDTTTSPANTTPTVDTLSGGINLQGAGSDVQDTTNTQAAVTGDVLESTTNPELASSTDATSIPLIDGTATTSPSEPIDPANTSDEVTPVEEGSTTLDVVAENIDSSSSDPATVDTVIPIVKNTPTILDSADLAPQPEFTFALTGKHISSKRKVQDKNGKVVGEQAVTTSLAPTVDNTTGEVTVAGQCSAKEFVVLLFKNPNDYIDDPRSYIVNRAYPCEGGAFSYSITDLPPTLPNGNYYLLVGQQGDTGAWEPITSITEVTINKNQ